MSPGTIVLIILIIVLIGALPTCRTAADGAITLPVGLA